MSDKGLVIRKVRAKLDEVVPIGTEAILFGSRARGDARPDLDWGILILLSHKGRANSDDYNTVGDPVCWVLWDMDQDVNVIVQPKSEWSQKSFTPFLQKCYEGRNKTMSLNEAERQAIAPYRIEKSRATLVDAEKVLEM